MQRAEGEARAVAVQVIDDMLVVRLEDGRVLHASLDQFPRLATGDAKARTNVRFIDHGTGLHWPDLDEDISVSGLLRVAPTQVV